MIPLIIKIEQQTYDRGRDDYADKDKAAGSWTTNYRPDGSIYQTNSRTGEIRTVKEAQTNSYLPDVSDQSALIITPDVDMSEATGFSGRFVRTLSQVGDALGGGNPDLANRVATNAINALGIATQSTALSAFSGKDTVYLLKKIEDLVISPNSIFEGAAGMESKAKSMMGVLQSGIKAKSNILNNPEGSTAAEISKARTDYLELNQLYKEYEALLESLPSASNTLDDDFNEAIDTFNGLPP
jgi:hypothetical protein